MRIMLINHYAGSPSMGMEYRPYYLARQWKKLGHEVVIIASSQAHVRNIQPIISKSFTTEIIDDIEYLWIKTPEYIGNGFKRVLNMQSFSSQIKSNARQLAKDYKPDLVIASSTYPLDNYAAHRIAKISGGKYFYEVHDLWPLSPMEIGGMSRYNPFIVWMQYAENYAYKNCDKLISMLPVTKEHMAAHGLNLTKWRYIPNGIVVDEWERKMPLNSEIRGQIQEIRKNYKLLVAYTGSLGLANAMDSLVKAAPGLAKLGMAVVVVGDGPEKRNLKDLKNRFNASNVYFIDPIVKQQIPSILELFDILYIGLKRQPLFRFGISPNKLIDYMMAERPVIQAIDAGNNMVEEAGCGISIEPENVEEIIEAANRISKMQPTEIISMGKNGRKFILEHHNYEKLATDFLCEFN